MNLITRASKGSLLTHQDQDNNLLQLKAGIEAAAENSFLAQFVGAVKAMIGDQKYYPRKAITISNIFAYLSGVATVDVVAQVKLNGGTVKTITIPAGSDKVTIPANIAVAIGGYLTVDIVSGTGNNLSIRFDY